MILHDYLSSKSEIATSEEQRDEYSENNSFCNKLEVIDLISHNFIHQ